MRLKTFGGLRIDGAAQGLGGAAGQRRPLALLLLFAVAGDRGVSRDKLLAYLWPESDSDRARSALRQALYALRRDLAAPDLFEGTTELRLNQNLLPSDVAEFDAAAARRDREGRERIVALYAGPLADGFCLSGAVEFERWLESERRTRAQQFAAAAEWLAREAAREGRREDAVSLWRRLSVHDPLNARVALQLVQALADSGDRAGALQHARVHEALVREELGAAPDPAIVALAETLRSGIGNRESKLEAPDRHRERGEGSAPFRHPERSEGSAPFRHPERSEGSAPRQSPVKSRSLASLGTTAWKLALAAVLAISAILFIAHRRSATHSLDVTAIAVAPFEVEPRLQFWREAVMDILAHNLDGAGPLRSVATSLSVQHWSGRADRSSALELARGTGAGIVLYGYIVPAGRDSVRAAATVLDASSGRLQTVEREESGDHMDRLTDSLTVDVLRVLGGWMPLGAVRRTPLVGASNIEALKAFLRGEQFYRRAQWDSAQAAYEEAIDHDSTFALALYRLGIVLTWERTAADSLADQYLLRAGALNHHLGPRDSLLVLGDSLFAAANVVPTYSGEWPFTRRLFVMLRAARQRYPEDPEIWYALGEAGYHFGLGATLTVPEQEILADFDRAIALDSAFSPAYEHTPELAVDVGGSPLARRYVEAFLRRHPDEPSVARMRLIGRLLDAQGGGDLQRLLDSASTPVLSSARTALRRWPDSAETALRLTRVLVARPGGESFRKRLVAQLAFRGHLREALGNAAGMDSPGVAALAYIGAAPADSLAPRMAHIARGGTEYAELVPAWWAARRDTTDLRAYVAEARRLASASSPSQHLRGIYDAAAGEAYLALARGDSAGALRLLLALPDSLCPICYTDRWTRARLLEASGRGPEALANLRERMEGAESPLELLIALERGRVAERLGRHEEAVRAYEFVVDAWGRGEPPVQGYVAEARAGLSRLAAGRPVALRGLAHRDTIGRRHPGVAGVRLRTFGGLSIEGVAESAGGAAGQRRPLALLLLLAASGERGMSRDKLLLFLWPESDAEHARSALRQTLYSLRRDLALPELFVGTTELRLNAELLPSDVADFDAAIARGDAAGRERAVSLHTGPLADGFYLTRAVEFERWLDAERSVRAQQFSVAAEALAQEAGQCGQYAKAVSLWRRVAVQEPLNARVAVQLMTALASAGDRAGALQHARLYEALVREELSAQPDRAVMQLAERLRDGGDLPAVSAPREPNVSTAAAVAAPAVPSAKLAPPLHHATARTEMATEPIAGAAYQIEPSAAAPLTATAPPADAARLRRLRRYWKPAVAATVVAAAATIGVLREFPGQQHLDPGLYAVMPLRVGPGENGSSLGDDCELLLETALGSWRDMRLVDGMRIQSAYEQYAAGRPELRRVIDAARSVGAGILAWGDVHRVGDSLLVRAALYDVARDGRTMRQYQVTLSSDLRDASLKFRELADSLLLRESEVPATADAMGTKSLDAWRAYADGHHALAEWDLARAHQSFERATELDASFPQAYLWLAETMSLEQLGDNESWRVTAERAAALSDRLAPADRELAVALRELADGRYQNACDAYRRMLARDSSDFRAWYGLGDCQARDGLVVRSTASPSGWAFRSSQGAAISAYVRALELTPASYRAFRGRSFSRLTKLLFTNMDDLKQGYRWDGRDSIPYRAFPSFVAETLTFVPYPSADLFARAPELEPATHADAVARNGETLRQLAERWVRAFPSSGDAAESEARALEAVGVLRGHPGAPGALEMVRRARALSTDSTRQLDLVVREVRLLLKDGSYAAAARLADSAVRAQRTPTGESALHLATLAALIGQTSRASTYLSAAQSALDPPQLADGTPVKVPDAAAQATLALLAYASFGAPADSVRAFWTRANAAIQTLVSAEARPRTTTALLQDPAALAFEVLGATLLHRSGESSRLVMQIQSALANGDTLSLVAHADTSIARTRAHPRRPVSLRYSFEIARLLASIHDTTRAEELLDPVLDGIPWAPEDLLDDPPHTPLTSVSAVEAALLVRAMVLRADLAASSADWGRASRWASAVVALWNGGDPALAPTVARMRGIEQRFRK